MSYNFFTHLNSERFYAIRKINLLGSNQIRSLIFPSLYLLLILSDLYASESPNIYYWDNQERLVSANGCKIAKTRSLNFGLTQSKSKLVNYKGEQIAILKSSALVKVFKTSNRVRLKRNFNFIKVISENNSTKKLITNNFEAERGIEGYLKTNTINSISQNLFEVNTPFTRGNLITFWKIAKDNQEYLKLNCPQLDKKRKYILFEVYDKTNITAPVAFIAVSTEETKVLGQLKIYGTSFARANNLIIMDLSFSYFMDIDAVISNQDKIVNTDSPEEPNNTHSNSSPLRLSNINHYICTRPGKLLNARDKSLSKVIFKITSGTRIKVFQGWGENTAIKNIGGKKYTFKKVQIYGPESRDQEIAWIAESYIKTKDDCEHLDIKTLLNNIDSDDFEGLDDPICCIFPTIKKPRESFTVWPKKFKSSRRGNRLHAAVDLYRYEGESIVSVARGVVIRGPYNFYKGTAAIDVLHSSGFVVRYGEISKRILIPQIGIGYKLKAGQRFAFVGKLINNCCTPMLHFELYTGSEQGKLSKKFPLYKAKKLRGNARFQRRSDLIDPTPFLKKWYKKTFLGKN